MKLVTTAIAAAVATIVGTYALAQTGSMSAQDFAAKAASSDMFEIRSSELALQKGQNAEVKQFAQMMINDHTKASEELKAAAEKDGVTVPTEMDSKHAAELEKLNSASGADFDTAYVAAQLAGHQEALSLLTAYAQNGEGAALKAHAEKTASTVQMHLEHVQNLD